MKQEDLIELGFEIRYFGVIFFLILVLLRYNRYSKMAH